MVSPYGILSTRTFLNHITSGIASNAVFPEIRSVRQPRPALYLFDGKVFPGSEGGGVFTSQGSLAGLILPALKNRETPVELACVVPIHAVLAALQKHLPSPSSTLRPNSAFSPLAPRLLSPEGINHLRNASVMIHISQSWGSGVLVSPHGCEFAPLHFHQHLLGLTSFCARCPDERPRD